MKHKSVGEFNYSPEYNNVYLPHSCDEWEIGTPQELEKFLKDGQELLKQIKEK